LDYGDEEDEMKRVFWQDLMKNKWVVPLAAITLTLAIGSISFAATGNSAGELPVVTTVKIAAASVTPSSTTTSSTTTSTTAATVTTLPAPILISPSLTNTSIDTVDTQSPEDLALQQAKENAILDLLRERMTEADRVTFDQLRSLATEQQLAVAEAEAELSDTTAKIRALVFKYLGIATTTSS